MAHRVNGLIPGGGVRYVTASIDLPVYPNGYVDHRHYCNCIDDNIGRAMLSGQWVKVCMTCGCLVHKFARN